MLPLVPFVTVSSNSTGPRMPGFGLLCTLGDGRWRIELVERPGNGELGPRERRRDGA